jgi:hypothetical protein
VRAHARAEFARLAYLRAVAAARAEPTPGHWSRLLRAARNLRSAVADHEREQREGGWRARAPRPARPAAEAFVAPGAAVAPARPPDPRAPAARHPERRRWPALEAEIARARALIAQSRRLVADARALEADLRWVGAARATTPGVSQRSPDRVRAGTPSSDHPPRG